MDNWLPIESAPKTGDLILVFRRVHGWTVYGVAYWGECAGISKWIAKGFSDPPGSLGLSFPSHWMPIPDPPSQPEWQIAKEIALLELFHD